MEETMAYEFSLGFYLVEDYSHRPRYYKREQLREKAPDLCQILERHYDSCCLETLGSTKGWVRVCKCPWPFQLHGVIVSCQECKKRIGDLRKLAPEFAQRFPKQEVEEIGVVGFGSIGKFFGRTLALDFNVTVYDIRNCQTEAERQGVVWGTLEQVASKDTVILAVPLDGMEPVLEQLVGCVQPNALVMDVCSVKQRPIQLMQKYLPQTELLGTHPLFGPQSAKDGWRGHRMAVCRVTASSPKTEFMLRFFRDQGLKLVEMTAERHDREMARVQGLTHFIARAAKESSVIGSEFSTKAFEHFMAMTEMLGSDSWELFRTIELGNPFAAQIRRKFVAKLLELEERLKRG